LYLSCHTHVHKSAERRARNIAGAEALAVARRPEVASREKNPAAADIRRFFPLSFSRCRPELPLEMFQIRDYRSGEFPPSPIFPYGIS